MKKNMLMAIVIMVWLVGCGTFPTASEYWKKNGKWPGYEVVQNDMRSCGFENAWNNAEMSDNKYIKASLCMEKKGYLFNGKRTCDKNAYKDYPACK
ncbi:hypothetical protein PL75_04150 [Neisseria arctica]|uniref:Lipoprotein n=1 Tax=Neisseria arctica TaxID=1470200 RepID=A0A0J0YSP5_9NEIS|nr:hypothetical protein [Neisseria arctica]KLT73112.1 hypothetical protein PL75_04150 [Neisseria arctica]UOO87164.1 hypothetical protein LVJ86_02630 [Neisseria arctica]